MLRGLLLPMLGAVTIFIATTYNTFAQTSRETQTSAIRLTIAETVLATNSQLGERVGSPIREMGWSAELTDRTWSLRMKGISEKGPIEIGMGGFLWGNEGDDWTVTYSGVGRIAGEPIQINGKADWPLDKSSSDRLGTNFRQVTKFGEHSIWAWIVGTEVVVGGVLAGGAAVVISAAAPPLTIFVGLGGALTGASAACNVSNTIRTTMESDRPPPAPAPPPAPSPGKNDRLMPKDGMLYAIVTNKGDVLGSGPDAKYLLEGAAKDGSMQGRVTYQ
jgi:hypothetical protein